MKRIILFLIVNIALVLNTFAITPPTLLSPSNGANNQAIYTNIDWTTISGNSGYIFQIDTVPSFNSPLFHQANTTGSNAYPPIMLYGTTYYWRVCTKSSVDTSAWSSTWNFTTSNTVNNISPSNGVINQPVYLNIDWSDITGSNGHIYQIDTSSNFDSPLLHEAYKTGSSNVYTPTLLYGTKYYWRARLISSVDTSAWSSTWNFTTLYDLSTTNLISPNNGSYLACDMSFVNIDWEAILNAGNYDCECSMDSTFSIGVISGSTSQTDTTISGLQPNSIYYWRIRGSNSSGYSDWSDVWSFGTRTSTYATDIITACNSYIWIDGVTYTSSNNTATHTLTNINGCDSVITLDLTINTVEVSVTVNGIILIANLSGVVYQWIDCNDNNNVIPGEINQSFTATANGNYAVIIYDGTCIDTSICYTITGVSVKELNNTSINIYPNPTSDIITIQGEYINNIQVTNISGKIIKIVKKSDKQVTIDLTGNAKGVYFVRVETKKEVMIKKIVFE